jgi:ligand-binding SRPBCC domain-containing protein
MARSLRFASELSAPVDAVWAVVATMKGVNDELSPWLGMTAPREAEGMHIDDAPVDVPLFDSWVLLFGVLPLDRHHFRIASVDRGRGFHERSTSWSERLWEHRRSVEPYGDGACVLTDRLDFTPRVLGTGPLIERVVSALFRHRHAKLVARFGGRRQGH